MSDTKEKQRFATGDFIKFKDRDGYWRVVQVGDFIGRQSDKTRAVMLSFGKFNSSYDVQYLLGEGDARKFKVAEVIAVLEERMV